MINLGNKKYSKRIFVITDGESEVKEADQIDAIIDQLNQSDTSVNIIAIDFWKSLDESEDSEQEKEPKEDHKSEGEGDDNDDKPNGGGISKNLLWFRNFNSKRWFQTSIKSEYPRNRVPAC